MDQEWERSGSLFKNLGDLGGVWVAQSVERLTLAQVIISQFVGLSPASGSVLRFQSLEPASGSVSPPRPPPFAPLLVTVSLSLKNR